MSKPSREDILIDLLHRSKIIYNSIASANKCTKVMSKYRYHFIDVSIGYYEKNK